MTRWADCLPSVHEAPGGSPALCEQGVNEVQQHMPAASACRRRKHEARKFRVILGYIVSLRPAWVR